MNEKAQACWDFTFPHEIGVLEDHDGKTVDGFMESEYPNAATMTKDEKQQAFWRDYYKPAGCDGMPLPLALFVCDTAFNCGVGSVVQWIQEILNLNGQGTGNGIKVDGNFGPVTAAVVAATNPQWMIIMLAHRRLSRAYLMRKSHAEDFGGWVGRIADLLRECGCAVIGGCKS